MAAEAGIQPWSATEYGNLALVQEIKKHPCLYNNTIPEYSRKDITAKAWQEIADKFECSALTVKKQWMRLRCAYGKDLRKMKKGKKKPHPIAEHIDFIRPYMVKFQQSNIHQNFLDDAPDVLHKKFNESFPTKNQDFDDLEVDCDDMEVAEVVLVENVKDFDLENAVVIPAETENDYFGIDGANYELDDEESHLNANDSEAYQLDYTETESGLISEQTEKASVDHVCHNMDHGNPRLHCVLSLLPEVDDMTERQFRTFKRKVLELIDEVKLAAI